MIEKAHSMRLLVGGKSAFDCIIDRIREAQVSIDINMFIWRDDGIGNKMAREVLEAANRGVNVRISKDKLGVLFELAEEKKQSFFHKKCDKRLYYQAFMLGHLYPMKGKSRNQKQMPNELVEAFIKQPNIQVECDILKGDHSKYYIIDDEILIIGGINIEDKEITTDVEGKAYHDYMVEFVGNSYVEKFKQRIYRGATCEKGAKAEFLFNIRRNGEVSYEVKESLLNLLDLAEESVDILMAYMGDKDILNKVVELVNQGVQVKIIMPAKANLQHDLNMKVLSQMMKRTKGHINIYLSPNMIHAKLIRIDNKLMTVGSTNLNRQAMSTLLELNTIIVLEDEIFKQELHDSITKQIHLSRNIQQISELKYNKLKAFMEGLVC